MEENNALWEELLLRRCKGIIYKMNMVKLARVYYTTQRCGALQNSGERNTYPYGGQATQEGGKEAGQNHMQNLL